MRAGHSSDTKRRLAAAHRACTSPCIVTKADGTKSIIARTRTERDTIKRHVPTYVPVTVPETARFSIDKRDLEYN